MLSASCQQHRAVQRAVQLAFLDLLNSVDPRIIVSVSLDCIDIEIISEEKNLKEGISLLLLLLLVAMAL